MSCSLEVVVNLNHECKLRGLFGLAGRDKRKVFQYVPNFETLLCGANLTKKLEHDLPHAATKDAALDIAILAAQNSMKALRLSNDADTVKAMRSKSEYFLNEAERIKAIEQWTPSARDQIDAKKVVKLNEPVSTRKLTTSEKILVLKASHLNGSKFPPWNGIPDDSEFEHSPEQQLFV